MKSRRSAHPGLLTRGNIGLAAAELARRDPDLQRILDTLGPPPLWSRPAGFRTLIQIILEQQVSLASARATFTRLQAGVRPFTPARFVALGEARLRSFGVTRQKAGYCVHLAGALVDGGLDLRALSRMDDAAVAAALTRLKGIGPWSADVYLLMALRRPDIWPAGDIALASSVRAVKRLRRRPSPDHLARIARDWRPFRSVAARMIWQHYLAERGSLASASRRSDGSARR